MKKYSGLILIVGALFLVGCNNEKTIETKDNNQQPTQVINTDKTQIVDTNKTSGYKTVKYREDQVDISNFETFDTASNKYIQNAWYDKTNQYMIINLKGVNYQYCLLPTKVWSNFKSAKSLYERFQSNIKGNYDCRKGGLPTYK